MSRRMAGRAAWGERPVVSRPRASPPPAVRRSRRGDGDHGEISRGRRGARAGHEPCEPSGLAIANRTDLHRRELRTALRGNRRPAAAGRRIMLVPVDRDWLEIWCGTASPGRLVRPGLQDSRKQNQHGSPSALSEARGSAREPLRQTVPANATRAGRSRHGTLGREHPLCRTFPDPELTGLLALPCGLGGPPRQGRTPRRAGRALRVDPVDEVGEHAHTVVGHTGPGALAPAEREDVRDATRRQRVA